MAQFHRTQTQTLVQLFRLSIELALNGIGLFNVAAWWRSRRRGKKRVAFQAFAPHLAQFFQPVIARLREENVELSFIILMHPQQTLRSRLELRTYARDVLRIPDENIKYYWQAVWDSYDLVIYADIYARFPIRKTTNWLMRHGAGTTSRMMSKSMFRKTMFDFDLILAPGCYDVKLIQDFKEKFGLSANAVPVGLPFLDRLADPGLSRESYLKSLSLDTDKKTILFAPHWGGISADPRILGRYFDRCIAILQETDLNAILKLHAASFNIVQADGIDWRERIQHIGSIAVDFSFDDIPALKFSDILITDLSSRAFNFMLLDKPVILISQAQLFDNLEVSRSSLMRRGSLVADDLDDLKPLIERADKHPNLLSAERQQVAEVCFENFGSATEAVVALIKKQIELETE